jgi:hypothetical protein
MLDKIFVFIALVGFVVFCGIVVVFVKVPDLTVTVGLILFIAIYDFWVSVFRPRATEPRLETGLEERPTAVSGKPLAGPKDDYTPRNP